MGLKGKICEVVIDKVDKDFIANAIQSGIGSAPEAEPVTINGDISGYIPAAADNGSQQSIYGYSTYDADLYGAVPSIGPVAGHNPQCDGPGNTIGTLVIDPNLPADSDGTFDITYTFLDNSGGGGGMFIFCPATGETAQLQSAGGSFGNNTGPVTNTLTFDATVLPCAVEDVLIGINAWGVSSDYPGTPRCDHLSAEVGTLTIVTPSQCAPARECFFQLFGCYPEALLPSEYGPGAGDSISVQVVKEECPVLHAYGAIGGDSAQFGDRCGVTVEKLGTGLWQVTFDEPYPTATYPVLFGSLNDGGTRDGTDVEVINGTQNANGFQIMAMTGDNGATADVLVDRWISFAVPIKKEIVTDVIVTGADGGGGGDENVTGCIRVEAWDNDNGLLEAGEFSQLELKIDGVSTGAPIVHDYTTSYNGVDKSTWYDPWVAAINALPNWNITLITEVSGNQPAQGKPLWQIDYSGPGNEELTLCKGSAGTTSPEELVIQADATGALIGTAFTYGGVDPIPSPVFFPCE